MGARKDPGAAVGSALLKAIVDGVVSARAGTLPAEMVERSRAFIAQWESLESEMAPFIRGMLGPLLELDSLPDGLREALQEASTPGHPAALILQVAAGLGMIVAAVPSLGSVAIRQSVYDLNEAARNIPLTPTAAASAVQRGVLAEETGNEAAAKQGISPLAWQTLLNIAGEPPGLMDMLALFRRGAIDTARIREAIRYSRVHNTYIPTVLEMQFSTMSPADAVEMAVKGVTDPDTAAEYFVKGGGLFTEWELLFKAAGDAIGVEKALTLLNHGLINETEALAVIARSRINPIFYDVALLQRHHFLGTFQIHQALTAGTVDPATAYLWLTQNGLPQDQAAAFANAGASGSTAKPKAETEAMIGQMYVDRLVDEAQATELLTNIGYTVEAAGFILSLADAKRALSQQTTAVTAVRAAYLAGHITAQDASTDLDQLNIPPDARDQWLTTWAVEKSAKLKVLTAAQIGGMAKKGLLTYTQAIARWVAMGYSGPDAALLAGDYGGPPPPTSPAAAAAPAA